jgi:hypothetical protein
MAADRRRSLADGSQGVTHVVPSGDIVHCDGEEDVGLTVHDVQGRLQWSLKFFENLHMDLSRSQNEHLTAGIERYVCVFTCLCDCYYSSSARKLLATGSTFISKLKTLIFQSTG